jgi:chromosome segregation ATPase
MVDRIERIEEAITLLTKLNEAADTRNELMSEFIKQTDIRLKGLDKRQAETQSGLDQLVESLKANDASLTARFNHLADGMEGLQKLHERTEVRFNQFMESSAATQETLSALLASQIRLGQTLDALLASQAGLNSKLDILITRLDTWIESLASRNGG